MSRIRKAYENRLRALLERARARRLDQGLAWLLERARRFGAQKGISPTQALDQVFTRLRAQVNRRRPAVDLPDRGGRKPAEASPGRTGSEERMRFVCDAGLGGLARWLRAAGYDAAWTPGIADPVVIREAQRLDAVLLTTDSLLMERRLLRDGIIASLWLPPSITVAEQWAMVRREFKLTVREARCMACGGELRVVDKESVRARIPPRTYCWLDEYFACARCGHLFWHGTHWQRIRQRYGELGSSGGPESGPGPAA